MKILLTGISGRVGRMTALDFLNNGHSVRGFDKTGLPEELRGRVEMLYGELTDRYALLRAAEGCDAICHIAAIPHPGRLDDVIFETNVTGTQYALAAAEAHGITKFAHASTCCTFGLVFAKHHFDPTYLPMDENHPRLTQDLYGLSKVLNEETCATYTRRSGMTTVCLRLTTVTNLRHAGHNSWMKRHFQHSRDRRAEDLWTYIDDRDTARAFRLALENSPSGHHVAIIAARDSFTPFDIRDLIRKHFPSAAAHADKLEAHGCAYKTNAAEEIFGFVAEHSWREVPELCEAADEALSTD